MSAKKTFVPIPVLEVDILFQDYYRTGSLTEIAKKAGISVRGPHFSDMRITGGESPKLTNVSVGLFSLAGDAAGHVLPVSAFSAPKKYEEAHILEMLGIWGGLRRDEEGYVLLKEGLRIVSSAKIEKGCCLYLYCNQKKAVLSPFAPTHSLPVSRVLFAAGRREP